MKNKSFITIFLIIFVIISFGCKKSNSSNTTSITTQTNSPLKGDVYITHNDVFIRKIPKTTGKILGRLYFANQVKILKHTANKVKIGKWNNYWYKLKIEEFNVTGWAYGAFISKTKPKYKTKYIVVNNKTLNIALYQAVSNQNISKVITLLKRGADPNYANFKQSIESGVNTSVSTPLLLKALSSENYQLIKILLTHGANPNDTGVFSNLAFQQTLPLIVAIQSKNLPIIKLLLDHGANPNASQNGSGGPAIPIDSAISSKNFEIVKMLVDKNVFLNIHLPMTSDTPLKAAIDGNLHYIADLLRRHGAKENISQ